MDPNGAADFIHAVEVAIEPLRKDVARLETETTRRLQALEDEVRTLPFVRADVHAAQHEGINQRIANAEADIREIDGRLGRAYTLAIGGLLFPILASLVGGLILYLVTQ